MTSPTYEGGIVVGNTYDKYGTRNPVARLLVQGFLSSFDRLVGRTGAGTVLEVGCGEGDLSLRVAGTGRSVVGTDISSRMVANARDKARGLGLPIQFREADLFQIDPRDASYDLVISCEVLEHLEEPEAALSHLVRLSRGYILLSVPREPVWRVLNLLRGKYWGDLGNTPGHLQHWSRRSFLEMVRRHMSIESEDSPFPWTMVLCRVPAGTGSDARP